MAEAYAQWLCQDCQHLGTKEDAKATECDGCGKWIHYLCADFTPSVLKVIGRDDIAYICKTCFQKKNALRVRDYTADFQEVNDKFASQLEQIKIEITREITRKMNESVEAIQQELSTKLKKMVDEAEAIRYLSNDSGKAVDKINENLTVVHDILQDQNEKLQDQAVKLQDQTDKMAAIVHPPTPAMHGDNTPASQLLAPQRRTYADTIKQEANTIIIKGTSEQSNEEIKKVVKTTLKDFKIDKMKTTKANAVVLNMPDKETCKLAKEALDNTSDEHRLTTGHTKKMDPKIMITNVSLDEECKTEEERIEFVNYIKQKNPYLNSFGPEEIKVVFSKEKTSNGYKSQNIVIKCAPKARKLIHDNGETLYTMYGRHHVFDHYHVVICHHCQGFGHMEKDCEEKEKEDPRCGKCAGRHSTGDCKSEHVKCINCHKRDYNKKDHHVYDYRCPCYKEMVNRLAANTDHGQQ